MTTKCTTVFVCFLTSLNDADTEQSVYLVREDSHKFLEPLPCSHYLLHPLLASSPETVHKLLRADIMSVLLFHSAQCDWILIQIVLSRVFVKYRGSNVVKEELNQFDIVYIKYHQDFVHIFLGPRILLHVIENCDLKYEFLKILTKYSRRITGALSSCFCCPYILADIFYPYRFFSRGANITFLYFPLMCSLMWEKQTKILTSFTT